MSLINTEVKPFKADAFRNGEFIQVTDADLKGKWSVLIFMPAAFTFNCPTEVEDAAINNKTNVELMQMILAKSQITSVSLPVWESMI